MKKYKSFLLVVFGLILLNLPSINASTYYVATSGLSTNSGSIDAPLSFATAFGKTLIAGDTIIVRGGLYSFTSLQQYSKSGNAISFIHFVNYQGEIPILDFRNEPYSSSNQGVKISGNYVHFKGMIIQGAGDNGLQVTGSYNKIENCTMRWNCDSGLQMKTGSNNLILNCDSYENFDYKSNGGNADGFADKQYTNTGTNTYKGCRSWSNSDDGWDSYQKAGNTVYDSCWCYNMGPAQYDMTNHIRYAIDKTFIDGYANHIIPNSGNGNGFKLGGDYTVNNATLNNCVSGGSLVKGFDQNNNNGIMTLYNCSSYNNGYNYGFTNSSYGTLIIKNCASLSSKSSNGFNCKSVTQTYNSWNSGFSCVSSDFVSLDISQLLNARQADGSLPEITLLHLTSTSGLIDKGTNVGFAFNGTAPDLGAFEYSIINGIETPFSNGTIKIYPNPVKEKTIISVDSNSNDALTIQLFDMTGRMIFNQNAIVISGKNEIEVNTGFLGRGNYICRIQGMEVNIRFKLTK